MQVKREHIELNESLDQGLSNKLTYLSIHIMEGPYALLKHLILSFRTSHGDLHFIILEGTIIELAFLNIH